MRRKLAAILAAAAALPAALTIAPAVEADALTVRNTLWQCASVNVGSWQTVCTQVQYAVDGPYRKPLHVRAYWPGNGTIWNLDQVYLYAAGRGYYIGNNLPQWTWSDYSPAIPWIASGTGGVSYVADGVTRDSTRVFLYSDLK